MTRTTKVFAIVLVALVAATSAFATSKTASFAVTTTINPSCAISASPLNFGTYDPLGVNASSALTGETTLTVQCVDELDAVISLDQGLYQDSGSTAVTPQRRMQCADNDQEYLSYFLFQDASMTQVWGGGASAMNISGDGVAHSYSIYGSIPGGQAQEPGGFADTVVATVTY